MTENRILGLHHMTAICGPAQENIDFYAGVLGLRLVKLTVNFDDPGTYHLYYGDGRGTPGTILTFFPYPDGYPGRTGPGQASVTALAIPPHSLRYWTDRLKSHSVDVEGTRGRSVDFAAPDGLRLRLVAEPGYVAPVSWPDRVVPMDHAIGSMRGIVIEQESISATADVLTGVLGLQPVDEHTYTFADHGARIELVERPLGTRARQGRGSVHHIAFRVANEEIQLRIHEELVAKGFPVSRVMNRDYFKSTYFREPGGVLFEIATDPPGFEVDETFEDLGTRLCLPSQYEPLRAKIEKVLPALDLPGFG